MGGLATVTVKIRVAHNHIKSDLVRCGNEPGHTELSFTTKVANGPGIQTFW